MNKRAVVNLNNRLLANLRDFEILKIDVDYVSYQAIYVVDQDIQRL